jgi:hypothetical protein
MARPDMYRKLPWKGGDPRQVAEVVNNLVEGKSNNTGTVTLDTGWATTTTLYDERIGNNSVILLMPDSASAEASAVPYGEINSTTGQTAPSTSSTSVVEFDNITQNNGIYQDGTNDSRIYVRDTGVYNIMYSLQLINTTNDGQYADVWFRVNGTDVADSASRFGLPARKSSGDPSELIGAMNIFLSLEADDYIEIAGGVSDVGVELWYDGASVSPFTRPAIPSVILTLNMVSGGSYGNIYVSSQQKGQATITHFANNTANKEYKYVIIG